jgi:hypothetical protein
MVRAVLLAAGLTIASAAGAQGPVMVAGVPIPDRVAGLPHEPPHDFEKNNPGWGYSVAFLRKDWAINVYIYDRKLNSIPDDPTAPLIKEQLDNSKAEILQIEKRGDYANVVVRGQYIINDRRGRQRFSCMTFNYLHKKWSATVDSYLCIAGTRNKFFKIRATTKQDAGSVAFARTFVEAWIPVLWPK